MSSPEYTGPQQLPRFKIGEVDFFADLRLGEFRAVSNFIDRVHFASSRGKQLCRMAGIVACPTCGIHIIVSSAYRDELRGCVRCSAAFE